MKFSLTTQDILKLKTDCLVLPLVSNAPFSIITKKLDNYSTGLLSKIKDSGDINGSREYTTFFLEKSSTVNQRLLVINAGKTKKLSVDELRNLLDTIFAAIQTTNSKTATIILDEISVNGHDKNWLLEQTVIALSAAAYQFSDYKNNTKPLSLEEINLTTNKANQRKQQKVLQQALALVAGINFTKDLGNTPCNIATPNYLVKQAKSLAKQYNKLSVKILNEPDLERLKMNTLLAVGQGSKQSSHLVELHYKGTVANKAPIILVGKGVTFDTGGISLKPAANMKDLKYDMCGGATVFGVVRAIVEQGLPINVIGLIPTVENMPDGNSFKPGDVITSMSGQTVEIVNTDAEGRLILCDALTYAKKFKPKTVIDIATLTGAMMVALGPVNNGLFTTDDDLAKDLQQAAKSSTDKTWRMPLEIDYQKMMDSKIADMQNCGPRDAGSVTAACFLQRFVDNDQSWAHLDVAGTAHQRNNPIGATGRPVPLLVEYLRQQSKKH